MAMLLHGQTVSWAPVATRYDLDEPALRALLADEPRYRGDQVWDGLYRQVVPLEETSNLPRALRQRLSEQAPTALTEAATSVADDGGTVKWVWQLDDGATIETVLMRYPDRTTVCVSTQAGCAMACSFCATGQAGFTRQLTVGEVVEQVVRASWDARRRWAPPGRPVTNVVFMGMGEPLANYDATWATVERLHGAMGFSARNLTISTVGVVPGIRRLATEDLPVNLAVSLHAANDALRDELAPLNRRYPLAQLMEACDAYLEAKGRRLSFEWALIDGVNDRRADAEELAARCRGRNVHVNLIPLNATPGYPTRGTPPGRVASFAALLGDLGVNATVRRNRGTAIDAACGQLRAVTLSRR